MQSPHAHGVLEHKDPYEQLGIARFASTEEIKRAYRAKGAFPSGGY